VFLHDAHIRGNISVQINVLDEGHFIWIIANRVDIALTKYATSSVSKATYLAVQHQDTSRPDCIRANGQNLA
jgi:hypothetical protein